MKRFISCLMCICMIMSLFGFVQPEQIITYAAEENENGDTAVEPIVIGASFESQAQSFCINPGEKTISAIIREGGQFEDISFSTDTDGAVAQLFSDEECTQSVQSVSYDDVNAEGKKHIIC